MIGTPDCPDNCGCTSTGGILAIIRTAFTVARGILRSL
ncbi:hypothetical protein HNR21_006313 [Actinomadura cellulosilytica]|uniref:Uncharacterized protein n=1 Tax=Thermomonospora cellulosilytica TaxID=1411118 RepID=A0A7W3N4K9_9ACTN|nr:hypothetical protein [Thermomonospora cellulosilytica]